MNDSGRKSPCRDEGERLKRFPHLAGERSADKELLEQLPPDARREFERLLEAQYRSDLRQKACRRRLRERVEGGRPRRRPTYPPSV